MPLPQLKEMAKEHGVSVSLVHSYWRRCTQAIKPERGPAGYGVVVNCVKAKIAEHKAKAK